MAAMKTEMTVVPRRSPMKLRWFTGENVVEIAQWLVAHGTRATVEFHQFGENLTVNSYKKEITAKYLDDRGAWIDEKGNLHTKAEIETDYEEVARR